MNNMRSVIRINSVVMKVNADSTIAESEIENSEIYVYRDQLLQMIGDMIRASSMLQGQLNAEIGRDWNVNIGVVTQSQDMVGGGGGISMFFLEGPLRTDSIHRHQLMVSIEWTGIEMIDVYDEPNENITTLLNEEILGISTYNSPS